MDRALSVQVFEYIADIPAALAEVHRVLRPGGRVVLWDIDWTTLSWHADDAERMARMTQAWDRHLVHPALPRTLAAALRAAGFADVRCDAHVFCTTAMDPESFGGNLPKIIGGYLRGLDDIAQDDIAAWEARAARPRCARRLLLRADAGCCFSATTARQRAAPLRPSPRRSRLLLGRLASAGRATSMLSTMSTSGDSKLPSALLTSPRGSRCLTETRSGRASFPALLPRAAPRWWPSRHVLIAAAPLGRPAHRETARAPVRSGRRAQCRSGRCPHSVT